MINRFIIIILVANLFSCTRQEQVLDSNQLKIYRCADFDRMEKTIVNKDNEFVVVGSSNDVPTILVLDADLKPKFHQTYPEYHNGNFTDVIQKANGDYVAVGYTLALEKGADFGDSKALLCTINQEGVILNEVLTDSGALEQWLSVIEASDGSLIVAGRTGVGETRQLLAKYSPSDTIITVSDHPDPNFQSHIVDIIQINNDEILCQVAAQLGVHYVVQMYSQKVSSTDLSLIGIGDRMGVNQLGNGPLERHVNLRSKTILLPNQRYMFAHQLQTTSPYRRSVVLNHMTAQMTKEKDRNGYISKGYFRFQEMNSYREGYVILGATKSHDFSVSIYSPKEAIVQFINREGLEQWNAPLGSTELFQLAMGSTTEGEDLVVLVQTIDETKQSSLTRYVLDSKGQVKMPVK